MLTYALYQDMKYEASLRTNYKIDNYKDERIIFYNKALIKYSKEFLYAEGKYDIFETDVKKDLALNCIQSSLQNHIENNLEEGRNFRKNARNKHLKTEALIQKHKDKRKYLSNRHYYYAYETIREIADPIIKERNKNTCDKKLSVEVMYERFLKKYIIRREEDLISYKKSFKKPNATPKDKAYYQKQITQLSQWLKILYSNSKYKKEEILKSLEVKKTNTRIAKRIKEKQFIIEWHKKENKRQKKLLQLQSILYEKTKDINKIENLLKETLYPRIQVTRGITGEKLLHKALKLKDIQALKILLNHKIYPVDTYLFSSDTNKESFKLIINIQLKKNTYYPHYLLMFRAIRHHASYEKIDIIFSEIIKNSLEERLYKDILKHSIEFCTQTKVVELFLSKYQSIKYDTELSSLLKKTKNKCKNKKEIEALFNQRKINEENKK